MEVIKNDNQPLTQAEMEAFHQFAASARGGQAFFHPQVGGQFAPHLVAFFEKIGRFGITVLDGQYAAADGDGKSVDDALEAAWQGAQAVLKALKGQLNLNLYTFAVAWFPDMEPDDGILAANAGRSVHVLFGRDELVQRLVALPKEEQLQTNLSSRFIRREVAALSRCSAVTSPEPAEVSAPSVKGRAGGLVLERAETVNIYVTVVNGDVGDDPPLITVQGQ